MASFDIIEDATVHESVAGRQLDDEIISSVPEPIVIRGVGHLTLYVLPNDVFPILMRGLCVLKHHLIIVSVVRLVLQFLLMIICNLLVYLAEQLCL